MALPRPMLVVLLAAGSALLATGTVVHAVGTRAFVLDDASSLSAGEMNGTAVLSTGVVVPGASVRRVALEDVPVAWCVLRAPDGTFFVGTGHRGRLYAVRGDSVHLHAETGQLAITSLALGERGELFAGTLPEGRVFRIATSAEAAGRAPEELVRPPGAQHVWALAYERGSRTLYVATGPEGKVFAVDARGSASVYWDAEASHVMSIALEGGVLWAGTSDAALVVRLRGPGRAEVVADLPGNEVTSLAVRDGVVVAAGNEMPPVSAVSAPSRATAAGGGPEGAAQAGPRPRAGKGRLYRIEPDGRVEAILDSDEGHFTRVQLAPDGVVWAGLGKNGHLVRVMPDRSSAVYVDVDERQVLDLDMLGEPAILVTGDGGAFYRVQPGRPAEATWTSKVLDARFVARFGELVLRGTGALRWQTRSGNVAEVDATWSEWSAMSAAAAGPIRSAPARFLQIRVHFPAEGEAALRSVAAYYLPQNQRPFVRDVALETPRRGDEPPTPSTRYKLTWRVDNPDEDRLRFRLRYRPEGETRWRELTRETEVVTETSYTWDTSAVPDGWYVVEVTASDEPSNPEELVLRSSAQSEPFLVDNHPPSIEGLRVEGGRLLGLATDSLGPIARLELAVDGGPWRLVFPADGLFDTARERFEVDLSRLGPGEHVVAVRAWDSAGNTVSREIVVR
ncbi:MAG: hypothetical protein NZ898_08895 [Myxococcota bacterium]|nr:hypothetical protein [Myxococcota bacterium]MDW8363796.1 hypothetical protein [Myxococcales bacterium]